MFNKLITRGLRVAGFNLERGDSFNKTMHADASVDELRLKIRRYMWAAAIVTCMLRPAGTLAQMSGLNPTAVEVALLPRFCWGQMEVPDADGPQYNIPAGCGWGMNHYCPGLVWLIRARTAVRGPDRVAFLRRASAEVRYTVRAIEKFPGCPVRPHLERTVAEIESLARRTTPSTSRKVPGAPVVPR